MVARQKTRLQTQHVSKEKTLGCCTLGGCIAARTPRRSKAAHHVQSVSLPYDWCTLEALRAKDSYGVHAHAHVHTHTRMHQAEKHRVLQVSMRNLVFFLAAGLLRIGCTETHSTVKMTASAA